MVTLPHQRPGLGEPGPCVGQVRQRTDLPGQVVQPDLRVIRRLAGTYLEQAEVVVVGRVRRAQERGAAGNLRADLEAESGSVELDGALETVHVEDGVVKTADGHLRFPPSVNC